MSILKSNFPIAHDVAAPAQSATTPDWKTRALESIAGSMVFVEAAIIYWDIRDERV